LYGRVAISVDTAVLVGVGGAISLTISCGGYVPSRLETLTLVLLVEVKAKLTNPLPLTSEVTSIDNHVPASNAEYEPTVVPMAGILL